MRDTLILMVTAQPGAVIDRRGFLRGVAALGAACSAGGACSVVTACRSTAAGAAFSKRSIGRVVVIGAGLAGLMAAERLAVAGFAVTVLEARARVGGRVYTLRDLVPGVPIEAGADFIAPRHSFAIALAERLGLRLVPVRDGSSEPSVVLAGEVVPASESRPMLAEIRSLLEELAKSSGEIDTASPWATPAAEVLDRWPMSEWLRRLEISDRDRRALGALLTHVHSATPDRQSALASILALAARGPDEWIDPMGGFRVEGGNDQLAERLASRLPTGALRLASPVNRVELRDRSAVVSSERTGRIECDHVVLATPPVTWGRIVFTPALADGAAMRTGPCVKALVLIDGTNAPRGTIDALTEGEAGRVFNAGAAQGGGPRVIAASITGPAAELHRLRQGTRRTRGLHAAIEPIWPGFVRAVRQTWFIDWTGDEWTGGSGAFPAPGELTRAGPILASGLRLAGAPVRLHFAGDHCSPECLGTMEGALRSGAAAAERIIAFASPGPHAARPGATA